VKIPPAALKIMCCLWVEVLERSKRCVTLLALQSVLELQMKHVFPSRSAVVTVGIRVVGNEAGLKLKVVPAGVTHLVHVPCIGWTEEN